MTIEQKAREIVAKSHSDIQKDAALSGAYDRTPSFRAARLGIIEGLEMADQKLKVLMLGLPVNGLKAQALLAASAAIHALIGEKR